MGARKKAPTKAIARQVLSGLSWAVQLARPSVALRARSEFLIIAITTTATIIATTTAIDGTDGTTNEATSCVDGARHSRAFLREVHKSINRDAVIRRIRSRDLHAIVERVIESLKAEGFGELTDIDVKATMKKKLDLDFRGYPILGACNAPLAHQALTVDDKIGTMFPCNVSAQDIGGGQIEIATIDPAISMQQVGNPTLKTIQKPLPASLIVSSPQSSKLRQSVTHTQHAERLTRCQSNSLADIVGTALNASVSK